MTLIVDALRDAAENRSIRQDLRLQDLSKLNLALADLYPQVPLIMSQVMKQRRVRVADDKVMSVTFAKLRNLPQVKDSPLLDEVVSDAAYSVFASKRIAIAEPSWQVRLMEFLKIDSGDLIAALLAITILLAFAQVGGSLIQLGQLIVIALTVALTGTSILRKVWQAIVDLASGL